MERLMTAEKREPGRSTARGTRGGASSSERRAATWDGSRAIGNSGVGMLQRKLAIGAPGDRYEEEADRVADELMRDVASRPPGADTLAGSSIPSLQPSLAAAPGPTAGAGELPEGTAAMVDAATRSGGQPLDARTRGFMERGLGQSFADVRVHTGSDADRSARAVGALGYAVGRDIVFAGNEYAPGTERGLRLLAHELTHVVQQRGADRGADRVDGGSRTRGAASRSSRAPALVQRIIPTPGYNERQANAPRRAEMRQHIAAMRTRMAEARYAPVRAQATQALDAMTTVLDSYDGGRSVSGGAPVLGYASSPSTTVTAGGAMNPLGIGVVIGIGIVSIIWGSMGSSTSAPSFADVESAYTRMDAELDRLIQSLPAPTVLSQTPVTPPTGVPTQTPVQAPAQQPQGAQQSGTVTTTVTTNPSPGRQLVADSGIFMDRQNPGDDVRVRALLASSGTTLYVPEAAWGEVIRGDRYGTQAPRLAGQPGGARVIRDIDGTLTGIPPAALVPSGTFNQNDMKIVQRAKERSLPLVTVNLAMATQISGVPARALQWGTVSIIGP